MDAPLPVILQPFLQDCQLPNSATNLAGGGGEALPAKEKTSLESKNRPYRKTGLLALKPFCSFFSSDLDGEVNRWAACLNWI
jgi:hypothetical protein